MKTKMMIAALALAVGMMGVAPSHADAKPKKHRKAMKKAIKQHEKFHRKQAKRYHKRNDRYHNPYKYGSYGNYYKRPKYKTPKRESESWGIYTTPGGGLGFYYNESKRPGYGYYF